ncbi:hypothetical protein JKP88DRAFT_262707 [Tribonema minus]|uniref:Uncharacterized protein n=1 Tax=Tribonema minus TaxID=303371 RepID=A0A836CH61_9STRA|nr:hypothetical protein JKP88DRAFT_262707 [Tribonema minus]
MQQSSGLRLRITECSWLTATDTLSITATAQVREGGSTHLMPDLQLAGQGTAALDADLCSSIVHFIGSNHHLQLASTSRAWRALYTATYDDHHSSAAAMTASSLTLLQWALDNGCPASAALPAAAARCGNLAALRWLRARGCAFDARTCSAAAAGGHLAVLQWARAERCEWTSHTCSSAARAGALDVLVWARRHGCAWDAMTAVMAAGGGHLACLRWACGNGVPMDRGVYKYCAAVGGSEEVRRWAGARAAALAPQRAVTPPP